MKRLVKLNNDSFNTILDWVSYHENISQKSIEKAIQDYPNSLYNGVVYRGLNLSIRNIAKKLDFDTTYEGLPAASKQSVENAVKQCIEIDNRYQSFAKNIDGVLSLFCDFSYDENEQVFLIESNTSNGLDITELFRNNPEKYKEETGKDSKNVECDNEILAKFTNDYKLLGRLVMPTGRIAENYLYVKDYPRFKVTQQAIDKIINDYGKDIYNKYKDQIDQGIDPDLLMNSEGDKPTMLRFVEI